MQIDKDVKDVKGFKGHYNDFIKKLMADYKEKGDLVAHNALRNLLLRGTAMGGKIDVVSVEIRRIDDDHGQFIVVCNNDDDMELFMDLWQEYDRRWSDSKDAMSKGDGSLPLSEKSKGQPVSRETVEEYHHLAKTTKRSANNIKTSLNTSSYTYYKLCAAYTGEEPIDMAHRARLIKEDKWPPTS